MKKHLSYNAVVNTNATGMEFKTISEAIKSAPQNTDIQYTILIKKGIYNELIKISRPNITLIGEDENDTVIEYTLAAGMIDNQRKKVGTSGSAIFVVEASNISIEQLTIRNSFDFNANQALSKEDVNRLNDTQAVAVSIEKNIDYIRFEHVVIEGYQDTLYLKEGSRSYFINCIVKGHVDFIFGGGIGVFNECTIVARSRDDKKGIYGYITAPSTPRSQTYGIIIMNSILMKEIGVPSNSFALGRPWHPTKQFDDGYYADPDAIGMALFINNKFDDHIYGWDSMSGKDKSGQIIRFYPKDSRFYEYKNIGSNTDNSTHQISSEEAEKYRIEIIFSGWSPRLLRKNMK